MIHTRHRPISQPNILCSGHLPHRRHISANSSSAPRQNRVLSMCSSRRSFPRPFCRQPSAPMVLKIVRAISGTSAAAGDIGSTVISCPRALVKCSGKRGKSSSRDIARVDVFLNAQKFLPCSGEGAGANLGISQSSPVSSTSAARWEGASVACASSRANILAVAA